MKYKVGDKVKIKTWESIEKEYGLNIIGNILCPSRFSKDMEKKLTYLDTNRILTISRISSCDKYYHYIARNFYYPFYDSIINYSLKEKIYTPVKSRWELLDL